MPLSPSTPPSSPRCPGGGGGGGWAAYVAGVRGAPRGGGEKVWGGQLELLAFARAMGVRVEVYAVGMPVVAMGDASAERVARVSYHRKYYGLGEHYNQVIPVE